MRIVGVLIEDVPGAIREAVERDASSRDISRSTVVCEILARRYRVPYEPSGYPYREADGAVQWNIRMPENLRDAIRSHARSLPGAVTQRGVILLALADHYELPVQSPRKRPSQPPLDPEVVVEARARYEAGESLRSLSRRYEVKRETLTKAIRTPV